MSRGGRSRPAAGATVVRVTTLLERLGRPPGSRLVIVSCDGLGFSHASNEGVYEALRDGTGTSANLMVPAPWSRAAAAGYRGEDVGVLLTLNSEHDTYRWRPLTHAPSLLDGDGGFPRTLHDLWEHADLDEVRKECRAQIERAIYWGFDVSHLGSHLFSMQLRPEFFDVFLDLATDFALPVRLGEMDERDVGFPYRALAAERGVVFPDHLLVLEPRSLRSPQELIDRIDAGVTEILLRPARDTPELRAVLSDWQDRVGDHDALLAADGLRAGFGAGGAELIGFRTLRRLAQQS
jgi:predicted glycoside hydrolase/deacetylase ChbG (UPF0249 family)